MFSPGELFPLEMCAVDSNFPWARFPPGELCTDTLMEDRKPDFLVLASEDSRGRGYGYSPGGSSKTDLGFPRLSCSPVETCAVDSNFPGRAFHRASFARKDWTI